MTRHSGAGLCHNLLGLCDKGGICEMSEAGPVLDRARCSQLSKDDPVSDAGTIFMVAFQRMGKNILHNSR